MASIQAVSKAAGVSVATVSRVINRSRLVSPDTKAAVHAAIRQLNYVPPPIEKRQRRFTGRPVGARKGSIALLFPDTRDDALHTSLSRRLTQGVGEILSSKSINLVVTSLGVNADLPLCIREKQVDGVILRATEEALALGRDLEGIPTVWLLELGDQPPHGDQVAEDNAAIGRLAAATLARAGHRHVACMNPEGKHPAYRARSESFLAAARSWGMTTALLSEDRGDVPLWNTEVWHPLAQNLVEEFVVLVKKKHSEAPTGLFLPLPDELTIFIRSELIARGVAVADHGQGSATRVELVVCTYDPLRMSALARPPRQIDIHAEGIGRAAAETLVWRLRNSREPQRRVLIAPVMLDNGASSSAK